MTFDIENKGNGYVGKIVGRLDTSAAQKFANDIEPLIDNADKVIYMDCSGLDFISSSGLRLFLSLRKATIAKGGDITIVGIKDEVKQVFSITGFYSLFKFEDSMPAL